MCGFIGCFRPEGRPLASDGVLEKMLRSIKHRGPDDDGFHSVSFARGTAAPHLPGHTLPADTDGGFGFARLSIQDLSEAGHQPMTNRDGSVILVFNGEIYNAAELREHLRADGAVFRGHSDTEVVLRLYEVYGWDTMIARIEGMYAIAIADVKTGVLRVVRDPFGIKPMYHTQLADGTLLIGSEIKAFLQHPEFHAELENAHLAEQLMFRYTAWNRTLLRGVQQLPPGHELLWRAESGELTLRRYWQLPDATDGEADDASVREALRRAVRSQLVSDVPLGTQLSGGIDSSLVTLDAARASSDTRHSFSIVFDDPEVSEDIWITEAARKAGVHSHRYLFSPQHFADDFARVTWHLDGPPGNPNTLAIDLLAREARHTVKVMLTGEGCDELFAGYNRFYYTALQQQHPSFFLLGAKLAGRSRGRLWRLFGQAGESLERQMVTGSAYGAAALVGDLLPGARVEDAISQRLDHLAAIPGTGLRKQIRYEAESYLPDLLLRQDKMTMAHGVECRVPFLDLGVARAARSLPLHSLAGATYGPNARMRGTKRLIKQLASAEFGPAFAYRRKRGFDVPLAAFFRQPEIRERMQDEWLPGLKLRGILDGVAVERLWQVLLSSHEGGKETAEALWVAVGLEVWARQSLCR
jgi:asparagine synthase (glutamine-hydrolysing)